MKCSSLNSHRTATVFACQLIPTFVTIPVKISHWFNVYLVFSRKVTMSTLSVVLVRAFVLYNVVLVFYLILRFDFGKFFLICRVFYGGQ